MLDEVLSGDDFILQIICGNKEGKIQVPFIYDEIISWSNMDEIKVEQNKKKGIIDYNGNVIIPCLYEKISDFKDGFALVEKDNKKFFINKNGETLFYLDFDFVDYFSENLARVKKNGKWGFINKLGEIIIPCIYDLALEFSEGLAVVKKNEKDERKLERREQRRAVENEALLVKHGLTDFAHRHEAKDSNTGTGSSTGLKRHKSR